MTARIFNTLLGTWLFWSAFAWPHTPSQSATALVCGGLTVLTALLAIFYPKFRYLTALVGLGLVIASISTLTSTASLSMDRTFWHNAIIAIVIFVAALVDRGTVGMGSRRWRNSSDELAKPIT